MASSCTIIPLDQLNIICLHASIQFILNVCQKRGKSGKTHDTFWTFMILSELLWYFLNLYKMTIYDMNFRDFFWTSTKPSEHLWCFLTFYGVIFVDNLYTILRLRWYTLICVDIVKIRERLFLWAWQRNQKLILPN